ncbi:MAG TPA: hypothetical protein PKK61_02160 [Defluviitaleaceae bacterium]|nr:hypothetical protein [Candidatus Epulonipiscium sp.]HOA79853.1 hypothetical protein [Defluviitaleaceae bacterium]
MSKKNKIIKIRKTSNEEKNTNKKCSNPKSQIKDSMIKGYQEMAEINLDLSKFCFEAEREVEKIIEQIVECERCGG